MKDEIPLTSYQAEWPFEVKKNLRGWVTTEEVIRDLLLAKDYLTHCDTLIKRALDHNR